jgi:hypothetical protein
MKFMHLNVNMRTEALFGDASRATAHLREAAVPAKRVVAQPPLRPLLTGRFTPAWEIALSQVCAHLAITAADAARSCSSLTTARNA